MESSDFYPSDFSKLVKIKELEYAKKQAYLKLPPMITFGYQYPDIDFNLLKLLRCRTDDGCAHYYYDDNIYSREFRTNSWKTRQISPFFEPYVKDLQKTDN